QVHDMEASPLPDEALACLPVAYGTAMGMLERGRVRAGETVVVTGASGGVGLALVHLGVARGARVLGLTRDAVAEQVAGAGAAGVISRDAGDLGEQLEALAPGGVDAVADVAGGRVLSELLPALRDDGRWIIAGAVAGPVVSFDLRRLYLHNLALIGSSMHTRAHFAALVEVARAGTVVPRVAATYPLAQIHRAQERFLQGAHVGKIVVVP
ncbi:MAG TPA: zinc-binding dehydrogenase, partial [Acidimicrobiales bacterium]|nr:zinc-binding dehydrogenase [Acidimicrobiales bacterium]